MHEDPHSRKTPLRGDPDRRDLLPSALLSAAVHGALVAALFTAVQWQSSSETVYAELWAPEEISGGMDPNGVAEKRPADETPEPPPEAEEVKEEVPPPEPEPKPEPAPAEEAKAEEARLAEEAARRQAAEEAQAAEQAARAEEERLAQERARAEEIRRAEEEAIQAAREREREEAERREAERIAQEKLAEERRQAEEARRAEEARKAAELERQKAEAARIAAELKAQKEAEEKRRVEEARKKEAAAIRRRIAQAARNEELARIAANVDPDAERSGRPSGDRRNYRRNLTGAARARYVARVAACVRQGLAFDVPASAKIGQFIAIYKVKLLPTGEQTGNPQQVQSSGLPAFDAAVERAIRSCNPFPKPDNGNPVPSDMQLKFDPVEEQQRR